MDVDKRSSNLFLYAIQDLIFEKYGLESWPASSDDGEWIDVCIFNGKAYVFTIGIIKHSLLIYGPGIDFNKESSIDLFSKDIIDQLCEYIDEMISILNISK